MVRFRIPTITVDIGGVPMGSGHPLRIQSMTTTDTMDTLSTARQVMQLADAGCDYVRITAPNIRSAENLANIKKELRHKGYKVPLIADIHFTPKAAEIAAKIVEKVRINPGNYQDKKTLEGRQWTEAEFKRAQERIYDRFAPLVRICREHGTAMRIGVNHGSLSDRILWKYGDTPEGMVESAYEFIRICEAEGYDKIVLSMKASNPKVMISAYRLLVKRMRQEGKFYPIHLGVTEAGNLIEGRIKSAVGIGTLLAEGIGDTVRVSLAEDPVNEVPVAKMLKDLFELWQLGGTPAYAVENFIYEESPIVVVSSNKDVGADYHFSMGFVSGLPGQVLPVDKWVPGTIALYELNQPISETHKNKWLRIPIERFENIAFGTLSSFDKVVVEISEEAKLVYVTDKIVNIKQGGRTKVIVKFDSNRTGEELAVYSSAILGRLFIDTIADGVWIDAPENPSFIKDISFDILQASRARITKVDYIACPSCGRTLFDLEEVVARVRARTGHLKGVKIAVMGCIVNGLGEMADADYGYVGSGPGKVNIYRKRTLVKRNVPEDQAIDELIKLIKEDGLWVEPPVQIEQ
ncbi:MAG: (E)-4-hydroxy-3-methylbut-2-enyl-diphosphate synthase [Chlorobi bacterium]|nr:(E)-4-hydroxy-3-methylbut-2-enyl-diphosphate synthase [Chlorobiota bacterium]